MKELRPVARRNWTLADDLHHVTYDTLGRERHHELLPMCRACHEDLHQILDRSKHWRTINRATATRQLVTVLRRRRALDHRGNGI